MVGNESWIYQGRQEHGWFGHGTSPETDRAMNPDAAPESLAERARYISHAAIAHFPASRRREYELRLDVSLERLARIMPIWSRGAGLDRDTFRERFFGPYASALVAEALQRATSGIARARTARDLREPAEDLAAAVHAVGAGMWSRFLAEAEERANTAPNISARPETRPGMTEAQFLLTPRPPFFFADPPKGVLPRLMERIPGQSGKQAANDLPSWARGARRYVGETPRQFARRLLNERFGPRKWEEGAGSDYNRIKKFGERAFRNPKNEFLFDHDDDPEI